MAAIKVNVISPGRCHIEHIASGAVIETDLPKEYGGDGRAFSATDLLASALGACIATSIDRVALRNGISLEGISIEVNKELSQEPKRVKRLAVCIDIAATVSDAVTRKLLRAARSCPVHRSLHPEIAVEITLTGHAD